jgi:hypothetical protein
MLGLAPITTVAPTAISERTPSSNFRIVSRGQISLVHPARRAGYVR